MANGPTWLTPLTATSMPGGLLSLRADVLAVARFVPRLERRRGSARLLGRLLFAGRAAAATLIALAPSPPIATITATGAVAGVIAIRTPPRARLTVIHSKAGRLG